MASIVQCTHTYTMLSTIQQIVKFVDTQRNKLDDDDIVGDQKTHEKSA